MSPEKQAFYEYHACLMEPWDGPASIAFTDGIRIGAVLDRNGLRPSRYYVTKDDLVIMASEVGVLDVAAGARAAQGPAAAGPHVPGRSGAGPHHRRRRAQAAASPASSPTAEWLRENLVTLEDLPEAPSPHEPDHETVLQRQQAFGYTTEDLKILLAPMAADGNEAVGSMGNDAPWPCSRTGRSCSTTTSSSSSPRSPTRRSTASAKRSSCRWRRPSAPRATCSSRRRSRPGRSSCSRRSCTNDELDKLRQLDGTTPHGFKSITLPILFPVKEGAAGLERAMDGAVPRRPARRSPTGYDFIILSDRGVDARARADPGAAGRRRRASSPDPRRDAHAGRPGARERRAARGASLRAADRLRRRGDQPLPGLRDARRHDPPRAC